MINPLPRNPRSLSHMHRDNLFRFDSILQHQSSMKARFRPVDHFDVVGV